MTRQAGDPMFPSGQAPAAAAWTWLSPRVSMAHQFLTPISLKENKNTQLNLINMYPKILKTKLYKSSLFWEVRFAKGL